MFLASSGWTPPEPEVDPDEKAARLYASQIPSSPEVYKLMIRAYLAGCTRGREGAKGLVEAAETLVGILENAWPALVGLAPVERLRAALASAKRGG